MLRWMLKSLLSSQFCYATVFFLDIHFQKARISEMWEEAIEKVKIEIIYMLKFYPKLEEKNKVWNINHEKVSCCKSFSGWKKTLKTFTNGILWHFFFFV